MKDVIGQIHTRLGKNAMFRLEVFSGRLFVDDGEIALSPKSAQILECLIRHRGEIVPRKQVFAEAWPDQVVTDAALTQAISLLRRELGDAYKDCIRTIPRRGYVLDLKAAESDSDAEGSSMVHQSAPEARIHQNKNADPVVNSRESGYRRHAYLLLCLFLASCAGTFAFVRSHDEARSHHAGYALTVAENAKTGLAGDIATLFHGDVDPNPSIGPRCERRSNAADARQTVLFVDTSGFYANAMSEIPFSICVWNGEKMEMRVGKSALGALYATVRDHLSMSRADRFEKILSAKKTVLPQSIDEYSAARDFESTGLLLKAAGQYEAAFLKHPDQAQIAMDYAEILAMIGETTKARIVYGSVISSPTASAEHRSLAAVALAEIEGRFADAAIESKKLPIDDSAAVRLLENYYKSSNLEEARIFVDSANNGQISLDAKRYLDARMLAWNGQHEESNALLSRVLTAADENLHAAVVWAMFSNYHRMFSDTAERRALDSARSLLKDLEVFYSRRQNYGEQLRVRQKIIMMELPLSDACTLHAQSEVLLRQAQRTGAPVLTARALQLRSWAHYRCGDLKRSEHDIVDAIGLMKESSDIRQTANMRFDYSFILMSDQRLDEARSQLSLIRLLGIDDAMRDELQAAESRIERLGGHPSKARHPCDTMLITLDDRTRRSMLERCIGVNKIPARGPEPLRFHAFMQSLHGVLSATRCREGRCVLPEAKRWADEIRASEPTPRRMMLEDFVFACASLPGMCDAPELRSVLSAHVSRWSYSDVSSRLEPSRCVSEACRAWSMFR